MKSVTRVTGPLMMRTTAGGADLIVDPQEIVEQSVSPIDLFEAALTSSIALSMANAALRSGVNVKGLHVEVSRTQSVSTRKVSALSLRISCPRPVPEAVRPILERAARNAPVKGWLNKTLAVRMEFVWER